MTSFNKIFSKNISLLLLLLFLFPFVLFAQTKTITGTVTNSKGQPASGVTVSVKGGTAITTTAENGSFTITAPTGATLVFTSIGFDPVEQKTGTGNTVTISLTERSASLNDVVVVGYGTQSKN